MLGPSRVVALDAQESLAPKHACSRCGRLFRIHAGNALGATVVLTRPLRRRTCLNLTAQPQSLDQLACLGKRDVSARSSVRMRVSAGRGRERGARGVASEQEGRSRTERIGHVGHASAA